MLSPTWEAKQPTAIAKNILKSRSLRGRAVSFLAYQRLKY